MSAATKLRSAVAWAWRVSPGLTALTIVNAIVLVVIAIPMRLLDPTLVAEVPAWNKPIKFSLSLLALGPTMLWIYAVALALVPAPQRADPDPVAMH